MGEFEAAAWYTFLTLIMISYVRHMWRWFMVRVCIKKGHKWKAKRNNVLKCNRCGRKVPNRTVVKPESRPLK